MFGVTSRMSIQSASIEETCLLDRLGHMNAEGEATVRRQATVREEERDWAEAAAYFQADVRGRGGARRGRLLDN